MANFPHPWVVVIVLAVLASGISPASSCEECDLQDAFKVILSQSSETNSDHHSHISTLDDKSNLARAVQKALDSLKGISQSVDFSQLRYRRFDGLGNNLKNPFWGAALHTERRHLKNKYDDGSAIPRYRSVDGNLLPSARDVSLKCFEPDEETHLDKFLSQMFMQWGQFVDHDIILTELEAGSNCCHDIADDGTHPDMFNGNACFPIHVSEGDRYFMKNCMSVRRSIGVNTNGVREQINGVTSYIDASQVYGPAKLLSNELRTFAGGRMKVTDTNGLPQLGVFKCRKMAELEKLNLISKCPHAGDPRVNVFAGLTIMHTIFHREHNRIAEKLAEVNPDWDDERLFQEARKIVIAINQKITYDEYVPKIIGPKMMEILGLDEEYQYNENCDASVFNVFGAAAFRFGHSQINGPLKVTKSLAPGLSEIYFKPEIMLQHHDGNLKNIIIHQARGGASKCDHFFSPEVLDKLFLDVDAPGESFDLPALAVHRSRDHGLPSYLDYVKLAKDFFSKQADGDKVYKEPSVPKCANEGSYGSDQDVDLFLGAMHEAHVEGGIVGPTFAYLVGDQFKRLRNCDRFFYENLDKKVGFTPDQLQEIKNKASLASVLCHNSPKLKNMHPRALERRNSGNKKRKCSSYEDFDFSHWKE